MVKVVVVGPDSKSTQRWLRVMQAALPEFEVHSWRPSEPAVGARYAIVWSPPDELFQAEPELKAVFNLGAGVDRILELPSLPADLPVLRLEDAGMAPQMAEYVIHHLSWLTRGMDTYAGQQGAAQWAPLPAIRYTDWPVGVMGMGKLGAHVARAVAALGYPVAGWARSPRNVESVDVFAGEAQMNDFLSRTRVLVNLLPLTPQTTGIINADLLERLQPNAVIINIARGGHVVDADLLAALDSGKVHAAVLDVFNQEPLPAKHPYWSHPRVRVTPHVAAATLEEDAAAQIRDRLLRMERGELVTGVVQRDAGY